ncbi:DnaD domain protein [Neobacillus niacini]|uniref:DnaD domain-containing protein n=1 Tax=Neobacillus niacini TaxID=86668 RepID=UPI0028678E0B|nr:DnaD domain protein [Neobacillus niacini]MDR7002170.1 DnaD/phage-associated family protein [Neobacillus niacini]
MFYARAEKETDGTWSEKTIEDSTGTVLLAQKSRENRPHGHPWPAKGQWSIMAKYRMVQTEFWKIPIVSEEMTPEDKYFYLYLLTNPHTTQIGIYKITKKVMAFDLGYSMESVHSLMDRFINHHKLIRYNPETRELAIKNWGKDNLDKGGKPVVDCILSELKKVEDHSLIRYVAESIPKEYFRSLYERFFSNKERDQNENNTYRTECKEMDDPYPYRPTIRGQKENKKENENEKQLKAFYPNIKNPPKKEDVKEIIEFWDTNGFGFTNVNAKQQLLSWLDDSSFLQPKEMILKAMKIACATNKRRLNYIVGILKNWENESLLTVEEVDSYGENQKPPHKSRPFTKSPPAGRSIPREFELDLTAGEA